MELGITPVIIRGEELKQRGFGGTAPVDLRHQYRSGQPEGRHLAELKRYKNPMKQATVL